jgi:hypothetical protein
MYYNPGTDSYETDFLEPILDTGFRCNVPYKIDRKKYQEIIEKYKQDMRIVDADVVSFTYDYSKHDDGEIWLYTFYAYPKNSPEGSEDFYDCFLFEDIRCNGKNIEEEYRKFIQELMGCVIGVDIQIATNLRNEKVKQVRQAQKELDEIVDIITTNL